MSADTVATQALREDVHRDFVIEGPGGSGIRIKQGDLDAQLAFVFDEGQIESTLHFGSM
jgi:hypothetical protein